MQNYIAKVFHFSLSIFTLVFLGAFAYVLFYGGVVPPSTDAKFKKINDFNTPMLYFKPNDSLRAYTQTVLFNKKYVKDSNGRLQVDYTTSNEKNIGVKTTAYDMNGLNNISFMARSDKPIRLDVMIGNVSNPDIFYVTTVKVSNDWDVYKLKIDDFKPIDITGANKNVPFNKNELGPYLEFSVPKSSIKTTGIFWIDKLVISYNRTY